jgi:HEAT repeat protein
MLRKQSGKGGRVFLEALSRLGPPNKDVVQALTPIFRDPDPMTRLLTARIVGQVDPNHLTVVSVLMESLQEKDPQLRRYAVDTLAIVRPSDEAVVTALTALARSDDDPNVRRAAQDALKNYK